jgi:hypothetical protein
VLRIETNLSFWRRCYAHRRHGNAIGYDIENDDLPLIEYARATIRQVLPIPIDSRKKRNAKSAWVIHNGFLIFMRAGYVLRDGGCHGLFARGSCVVPVLARGRNRPRCAYRAL